MDANDANLNRLKLANFFASCAIISSGAFNIDTNEFGQFDDVQTESAVAVAFGVISILFLAVFQFLTGMSPGIEKGLVYLFVIIWLASVLVFTFHEPFENAVAGQLNGFLGSWIGFASAFFLMMQYLQNKGEQTRGTQLKNLEENRKYLLLLFVGGVVVTIAGAQAVAADDTEDVNGYAVALGLTTVLAVIALYILKDDELAMYLSIALSIWLLIGALVTTSLGPFANLGNGYVAVWINVLVSSYILAKYGSTYDSSSTSRTATYGLDSK